MNDNEAGAVEPGDGPRTAATEARDAAARLWRDGALFLHGGVLRQPGTWWQFALYGTLYALVVGAVVAALEPSSTSGLPYPVASLTWTLHVATALALLTATTAALAVAGLRRPWPMAGAVLLLPVLVAPISLALDTAFGGEPGAASSGGGAFMLYVREVGDVAPASWALSILLSLLLVRAARLSSALRQRLHGAAPTAPVLRDAISGVPHRLGDDLVRVEAQDHYVLVVTVQGRATVAARFSDVLAAVASFGGSQCHRSHWVRHAHVLRIVRKGSAHVCHLSNGEAVPVSRRRAAEVRRRA